MYSLLIDSHGNELSIVLYKDKKPITIDSIVFNNQSKIIVPRVVNVLEQNNLEFSNISEIIVINGPGSFTGIRLGVTIGKTLAYCLNIPIKSISTLMLYAINVKADGDFSISIPDQNGYYIGKFNKNHNLIGNYFYLPKDDYLKYKETHNVVDIIEIEWEKIYKNDCLTKEDCYNIKPLYIKKIEVEK